MAMDSLIAFFDHFQKKTQLLWFQLSGLGSILSGSSPLSLVKSFKAEKFEDPYRVGRGLKPSAR